MSILPIGHRQRDEQSGHRIHVLALRDVRADLEQRSSSEHPLERPMGVRLMAGTKVVRARAHAELVDRIEGHVEEIRHNLAVEIKKLTQLQQQVDEVRLAIRELKGSTM